MMQQAIVTDVTVRDGLQSLPNVVPTERKLEWIKALIDAGHTRLEVASFVNRELVPTMADADELSRQLPRDRGATFGGVVLDPRGMERLLAAELDWAEVVVATSDSFLQRNQRCDRAGALARVREIEKMRASAPVRIHAYISCCFACPQEGPTDPAEVVKMGEALLEMGVDEVYLADTNGMGTPPATRRLLDAVLGVVPADRLGCHFHDTYGQAIANLDVALTHDVIRIDAAAAGLGGCMFVRGASGNVASEDVLALLAGHGLQTGIDAAEVARIGQSLCDELGVSNTSNAGRALLRADTINAKGADSRD